MPHRLLAIGFMELQCLVFFAAIGDVAIKTESATPEQLIVLWCVIGGLLGSFCSLHYYRQVSHVEATTQFVVNLCLSVAFSPILAEYISYWISFPVGLRLCLPVACGVGLLGNAAVVRGLPFLQNAFDITLQQGVDTLKESGTFAIKKKKDGDKDGSSV
jgi:uncharacterized membrane protein YsdA (DUF1294 family)